MSPYPLKRNHEILRETWCFLAGHDWKCSWRRVSTRKRRGKHANPWWDYVATWHYKCRRCRLRIASDNWSPWFKSAWWAWKSFWQAFGIVFECYWKSWPWRVRLSLPLVALLFGIEQGWAQWACDRHWPTWPTDVAGDLHYNLATWIESQRPKPPRKPRLRGRWVIDNNMTTTSGGGPSFVTNVRWVSG